MAITLAPQPTGSVIALPDNLIWSDETDWTCVAQSVEYSLTGAPIFEHAEKQAGRPITLSGGEHWAWITRAELLPLDAALKTDGAEFVLTLHDGRNWNVIPRHDGNGPLATAPVRRVLDSGIADPSSAAKYYIDSIRFWALSVEPNA